MQYDAHQVFIALRESLKVTILGSCSGALRKFEKENQTVLHTFMIVVTNEEVCNTIRHKVGHYKDLLTIIKKRKLKWYGRVTRANSLFTTILQGSVQCGRRKVDREKNGVTTSQNGPGKVLQRHRHWHMIESSGGNWSDVQQHSVSTTTLGQENDDDEEEDDRLPYCSVSQTRTIKLG